MEIKKILTIIGERIRICDNSFKMSKDEKWIHIGLVLRGLYKEISGNDFDVIEKESEK